MIDQRNPKLSVQSEGETLQSRTLADWVARHGPLSRDTALQILTAVLRQLREMHDRDMFWGDLSPADILFNTDALKAEGRGSKERILVRAAAEGASSCLGESDRSVRSNREHVKRDLQSVAWLFSTMITGLPSRNAAANAVNDGPRWIGRFVQRLSQSTCDAFGTADEALAYLRSREDRLQGLHAATEHNASSLVVPHLLETLYITPSTVCNLGCRFCAYPKTTIAKRIMGTDLFSSVLNKACDYGFNRFGLTPLLGEALIDRGFGEKLDILEQHSGVTEYSFCTNLSVPSDHFIERLASLTKLGWLSISLYGHSEKSFEAIANAPGRLFFDVLRNLERLVQWPGIGSHVELRVRTGASCVPSDYDPRLRVILQALEQKGVRIRFPNDRFSNWGGLITIQDVTDLDIHLKPAIAKTNIPCTFLFYKHTVLPDGRVNACYADDGNATMIIGDLQRETFEEIYSLQNARFVDLISSQSSGVWSRTCDSCTGYRSALAEHYSYTFHHRPFLRFQEWLDILN